MSARQALTETPLWEIEVLLDQRADEIRAQNEARKG